MGIFTANPKKADKAAQPATARSAQPTTPPAPTLTLMDHAPFAATHARLDELRAEKREAVAEAARLSAEIESLNMARPDPIAREGLLLWDSDGAGGIANAGAKTDRLAKVRQRIRVLDAAIAEGERHAREHDRAAGRAVVLAAEPEYRRLLVEQVKAVVAAARATLPILDLLDRVSEEVGSVSSGLSDYSYRRLGDMRDRDSGISLFIAELVSMGFLDGNEDFLSGVSFYAKRPDGVVVNKTAPALPDQRSRMGPRFSLSGRQQPDTPTAPTPRSMRPQPADPMPHEAPGPKVKIRLLKDMDFSEAKYPAGDVRDWPVNSARVLVARGHAVYDQEAGEAATATAATAGA